jgi:PadR family transcriptional regulator PadR
MEKKSLRLGTVEMLILHLLSKKELYGYQLSTYIRELSAGSFEIMDSTLYPALYKMSDNGFITERRMLVGKRRTRVYYTITDSGRERLADLVKEYKANTNGIMSILAIDELPEVSDDETE